MSSTSPEQQFFYSQRIGPWRILFGWPDDRNQVGPLSVTIVPADDVTQEEVIGGVTSTVLRQIDWHSAREQWQAAFPPEGQSRKSRYLSEQLKRLLEEDGVSDGYLAFLAEAYIDLVRAGRKSVAAELATMTGRSPDTMRQHLHKMRKAGMLTSVPGKVGGQLTPRQSMEFRRVMSRITTGITWMGDEEELKAAEEEFALSQRLDGDSGS